MAIFAQSVSPELISSAGEYQESSTASISWSLGEPMVETYTNGSQVVQGFHAVEYDLSPEVDVPKMQNQFNIKLFPNPTSDFVVISQENAKFQNANLNIYDLNGKLLMSENLISDKNIVSLKSLPAGTFVFSIKLDQTTMQTFKVVKF